MEDNSKQQELWERLMGKLHNVVGEESKKLNACLRPIPSDEVVEDHIDQALEVSKTIMKVCKDTCVVVLSMYKKEAEKHNVPIDQIGTKLQVFLLKTKKDIETLSKEVVTAVLRCVNDLRGIECDRASDAFPALYEEHCRQVTSGLDAMVEYFGRTPEKIFLTPSSEAGAAQQNQHHHNHPQQPTQQPLSQQHGTLIASLMKGETKLERGERKLEAAHRDSMEVRAREKERLQRLKQQQAQQAQLGKMAAENERKRKELEDKGRELMQMKARMLEAEKEKERLAREERERAERERAEQEKKERERLAKEMEDSKHRNRPGFNSVYKPPAGAVEPQPLPEQQQEEEAPRFCGECGAPIDWKDGAQACDVCNTPFGYQDDGDQSAVTSGGEDVDDSPAHNEGHSPVENTLPAAPVPDLQLREVRASRTKNSCSVCGTIMGSITQRYCGVCGVCFVDATTPTSPTMNTMRRSEWKKKQYTDKNFLPTTAEEIQAYKQMMRQKYEKQQREAEELARKRKQQGVPTNREAEQKKLNDFIKNPPPVPTPPISPKSPTAGRRSPATVTTAPAVPPRTRPRDKVQQQTPPEEHQHAEPSKEVVRQVSPREAAAPVAAAPVESPAGDAAVRDAKVAQILRELQMEKYVEVICDREEITYDAFLLLTNEDLLHMGIPTGPRKIIMAVVAELSK